MGAFYETIPRNLITWILEQKVFWVASAPLSADGHINVSPKGGQYFGIVDSTTFWYVDLTGSGAHVGDKQLTERVRRVQPAVHAFGHVHASCVASSHVGYNIVHSIASTLKRSGRGKLSSSFTTWALIPSMN